jgi:hypothetical protein
MTVVAFNPARFSSDDLATFDQVAWPRISAGLWSHTVRNTCGDGDQVLVYFPGRELPVFRFERDSHGTYTLWFRSAEGAEWSLICASVSATDCLSLWIGDSQKGAAS